jgi:hypothetical protein
MLVGICSGGVLVVARCVVSRATGMVVPGILLLWIMDAMLVMLVFACTGHASS